MNTKREIPKEVPAPRLCEEAVRLITDVCFLPEEEASHDNICGQYGEVFIFGTSHPTNHRQILSEFLGMCGRCYKPEVVYIAGGIGTRGVESNDIFALFHENLFCQTKGRKEWFSSVEFRLDKDSRNTMQNVQNAIKLGLHGDTGIIFVAKSGHCGRCKLTLSRFFPRTDIRAWGYDATVGDGLVSATRDTWFKAEQSRGCVWAEFLRIGKYGERGDIAYPDAVRQKVERVHALTKN